MASSSNSNSTGPASNPSDQVMQLPPSDSALTVSLHTNMNMLAATNSNIQLAELNEAHNRVLNQLVLSDAERQKEKDVLDSYISLVARMTKSNQDRISELSYKFEQARTELDVKIARMDIMSAENDEEVHKLSRQLEDYQVQLLYLTNEHSEVCCLLLEKDTQIDRLKKQLEEKDSKINILQEELTECHLKLETLKQQLEESRGKLNEWMTKQRDFNIRLKRTAVFAVSLASMVFLYKAGGLQLLIGRLSRSRNENVVLTERRLENVRVGHVAEVGKKVNTGEGNLLRSPYLTGEWRLEHARVGAEPTSLEEEEAGGRQQGNPLMKLMKEIHTFVLRFIGALFSDN